jgi:hypothetical protein
MPDSKNNQYAKFFDNDIHQARLKEWIASGRLSPNSAQTTNGNTGNLYNNSGVQANFGLGPTFNIFNNAGQIEGKY